MSRSFADEVCNIIDDNKDLKFEFIHCATDIETMIAKVAEGRKQERKRGISNAKMYEFEDMESLSKYLLSI